MSRASGTDEAVGVGSAEPLYQKRKLIVTGAEEAPPAEVGDVVPILEEASDEEVPPGIPQFWLNVLRNNEDIVEQVRFCHLRASGRSTPRHRIYYLGSRVRLVGGSKVATTWAT